MPSTQPLGTMKRPPIVRNESSSSSLSGMEHTAPSFKDFVKRTAPLDNHKPLPPTPLMPRRASSTSPPRSRSRTPFSFRERRSSSVYSRTVSQWEPQDVAWRNINYVDEPIPPMPVLQPLAYSMSTPSLVERQPTPPLLQPRAYNPIITTPSPTASRVTTPSPTPYHEPSILLPTPPVSMQVPKKHLRTVSLEKANAAVNAPGAVHFLPEELRAQNVGKARSHEPLRVDTMHFFSDYTQASEMPSLPQPPTLVDNQGRQRALHSPTDVFTDVSQYPFPVGRTSTQDFATGQQGEKVIATQPRKESRGKAAQALVITEEEEPRGRTRHRGPRNMDYPHYTPNRKRMSESSGSEVDSSGPKKAAEYHELPSEQFRPPRKSPASHGTDSDDSVRSRMKMVPQPLFQHKPAAKLPGSVTGGRNGSRVSEVSPYRLSVEGSSSGQSSESFHNPFTLRVSTAGDSGHHRRSTSGSIPISPPTSTHTTPPVPPPEPAVAKRKKGPRNGGNTRQSAYYPFVAPRKGKKGRGKESLEDVPPPPRPLLAADIIAQRHQAPSSSPEVSPLRNNSMTVRFADEHRRKKSDGSTTSKTHQQPLHQRFAKGAVKYADLLTRPAEAMPERQKPRPKAPPLNKNTNAFSGSPHLLPSPVKTQPPKPIHLGWSDTAKTTFDSIISRTTPTYSRPVKPPNPETGPLSRFTHITAPARPLDESKEALREVESPRRTSSIFTGMFESWKEAKAERRREELKKIIKVVPHENEGGYRGNTIPVQQRRLSTFAWM